MSNLSYKKTVTEKFDVKGFLNEDGSVVAYEDKDYGTLELTLASVLRQFANLPVSISIKTVAEEELDKPSDELPGEEID